MKHTDSISIRATPDKVWKTLANPKMMELWNPKCVRCDFNGNASSAASSTFAATFNLRSKEKESRGSFHVFEKPSKIGFTFEQDTPKPHSRVTELFEIESQSPPISTVTHTVDFTQSGLPRPILWLMRFLFKFGKKTPDSFSSLETLKVLIEDGLES